VQRGVRNDVGFTGKEKNGSKLRRTTGGEMNSPMRGGPDSWGSSQIGVRTWDEPYCGRRQEWRERMNNLSIS
jgi:hypothetical protein